MEQTSEDTGGSRRGKLVSGSRRLMAASWIALAAVLVAGLVMGTSGVSAPRTQAQRVAQLANEVRCPSCGNLSAGQESTPAALSIRRFISDQVGAGKGDRAILGALVASYGPSILLRPPASGIDVLVWVLPVLGAGGAVLGLGLFFLGRRGGSGSLPPPSQEDRALVEEALARFTGDSKTGRPPPGDALAGGVKGSPSAQERDSAGGQLAHHVVHGGRSERSDEVSPEAPVGADDEGLGHS